MTDSRSPRPVRSTARAGRPAGPRERSWSSRPAALRLALCAGVVLLACLLRAPFLRLSVLDWDESLYLVMAQRWLAGDLPYVAVWDQHPVGLPALIAAIGLFTTHLLLATRVLACLAVAGTACLLFVWGERYWRSSLAGLLAALFYVLELSGINNLPANTEVFTNLLIAGGAAVLLEALRRRSGRLWWPATGGLVFGCALQIKYTVAPEVVLLSCGYLALAGATAFSDAPAAGTGRDTRALAARAGTLLLAGALPSAAVLLYFAEHAALGPWLAANVQANVTYVALVPALWDGLHRVGHGMRHLVIAIAVAAIGLARARGRVWPADRLPLAWTLLWLLGAAIDVIGPLKFWSHYFLVLAAPLGLLAAWAVAHAPWPTGLWRAGAGRATSGQAGSGQAGSGQAGSGQAGSGQAGSGQSRPRLVAAALLLGAPAVGGVLGAVTVLRMDDTPRRVAAAVLAQHPHPGDLYVYNYQPVIYYLTALRPPSRFVIPTELSDFSASSGSGGIVELDRILAARPRLIVLARPALEPMPGSFDAVVDAVLAGYNLIGRFHDASAAADVLLYRSGGETLTQAGAADGRDVPASRSAPP